MWADVKHADHASDEVADGFEVDAPDAPGAVDQQHDVGLRCGLTLIVCRETARVSETPGTPQTPESVRSDLNEPLEMKNVCGESVKKVRGNLVWIRQERERSEDQDYITKSQFIPQNVLQSIM